MTAVVMGLGVMVAAAIGFAWGYVEGRQRERRRWAEALGQYMERAGDPAEQ
jgi:hypothetical protein